MPYSINAVQPVVANVTITGVANELSQVDNLEAAMVLAVQQYFRLPFGTPADLTSLIAAAAGVVQGNMTSLSIQMTDRTGNVQQSISAGPTQRVVLSNLNVNFSA